MVNLDYRLVEGIINQRVTINTIGIPFFHIHPRHLSFFRGTLLIIHRYVCREVFMVFISVLSVLMAISFGMLYVRLASYMVQNPVVDSAILPVLILKVLEDLPELLPPSLLLATVLGLKRLCENNEMVVMFASGLHLMQIMTGLLWLALGLATLNLAFALFVVPKLSYWQEVLVKSSTSQVTMNDRTADQFIALGQGKYTMYFQKTPGTAKQQQQLLHPFIVEHYPNHERVYVAVTASQVGDDDGKRMLVMEDARIYSGTPGTGNYTLIKADRYELEIPKSHAPVSIDTEMLPLSALLVPDNNTYQAELQRRLSAGISVFVLLLMAIPMSIVPPHQSRMIRQLVIIFSSYFIYASGLVIAHKLVERGELPAVIGGWSVHLSVATIALLAIGLQIRGYRILRRAPAPARKRIA